MVLLSLTRRFPFLLNAALHSKGGGYGCKDGDNNLENFAPDGIFVVHNSVGPLPSPPTRGGNIMYWGIGDFVRG